MAEMPAGEREILQLGGGRGVAVQWALASEGTVTFEVEAGQVSATVLKARNPDAVLTNAAVYLVQRLADDWQPETPYEFADEYALMVDDPYWGRRIQGAGFVAAPFAETFVMGYRVRGRVLHDGAPAVGANVSLEGVTEGAGGTATFWDSQEYNELIWSDTLATYIEGATVLAPIMTDAEGRWSFICPKGQGAIYQRVGDRRDDGATAAPPARWLAQLAMVYRGRRAALTEEVEAVIDMLSGKLSVTGEPGAWVKVGSLDEAGGNWVIPESGAAVIEGLPTGAHNLVQFRLDGYGWDSAWGCARQVVSVNEGATTTVDMGPMQAYDPGGNILAGRIYERPGVPAAGVNIVAINFESGQMLSLGTATDTGGYWEVELPEEGLGGDPWVYDAKWGCMPIVGFPYSDVVLGARAYSGFAEMYKPEAWRKGSRGHANFQHVPEAVWIQDNETEAVFGTEEAPHGGWVTSETLPKFKFIADVNELLTSGPQVRRYSLYSGDELLMGEFTLESQNFEEYETLPGQFRAAGFYPEVKFLIGGKIHGGVVTGCDEAIGLALPEAYRIGLEFGRHEWYTQVTVEGGQRMSCFADLVCPYCGGPTWRDPDAFGYARGCCQQCTEVFGPPDAMDGRTHLRTPTTAGLPPALRADPSPLGRGTADDNSTALSATVVPTSGGSRTYPVKYHWRPDLYDENDHYLTQSGLGQATNAPRWFARHVNEVGDGYGFGRMDTSLSPPFRAGHDLEWFGELPEVQRELGPAQMKLMFRPGYTQAEDVTVELTCRRVDGATEAVRVIIAAGTTGPSEANPVGSIVRLKTVGKWTAEKRKTPFKGCGLYTAVTAARVVEPLDAVCEFVVVNDAPLLASTGGVPIVERHATPVALQLGVSRSGSGPHLLDDAVGQLFLFYARDGEIWMRRRHGLPGAWRDEVQVSDDGDNAEPGAEKDDAGRLRAFWDHGGEVAGKMSADDGQFWVEV